MTILARLPSLERALQVAEYPPMSAWWRTTLERFYGSGKRSLVLRVGRRGGKSSTLCRVAVLEALYGKHKIPPGDVGVVAIISVSLDEAAARLKTIEAILDRLQVPYRRSGAAIYLDRRPIVFKTFSATVAGVSGFTCICAICDEVAKWRDSDTKANPAKEVISSLRPTMATMPNARIFVSSSPFGTLDHHYVLFEKGDGEGQLTAYAPTWEANPSVAEAQTRSDEPDERVWRREYLAIPQAGVLGAFDMDAIDRAFVPREGSPENRAMVVDLSSGRVDSTTWGICGWVHAPHQTSFLKFELVDGISGSFWKSITGSELIARIAQVAKAHGIFEVHGDQRESMMASSEFDRHGINYRVHDWTSASKPKAVERVRRWLADNMLALPNHDTLRREMVAFEERITPSGSFTFGARGSGHDDYVALLITAAMADIEGEIDTPGYGRLGTPEWERETNGLLAAFHKVYPLSVTEAVEDSAFGPMDWSGYYR